MSQNQEIATGTGTPVSGHSKFILCVLVIVMVLDFVSFGSYWLGQAVTCGDWTRLDQNLRSDVWPQFLAEAEYYAKQDMPTVNFVLDKYLSLDRRSFGNAGPFIDYFFQKLFRMVSFVTYMAGGLAVILFALTEGCRKNKQKRQEFQKISATAYHFTLYTGGLFTTCFFFLYVFMPGKLVIPKLLHTQVPFLLYHAFFWAAIMTVIASFTIYWMFSNITNA